MSDDLRTRALALNVDPYDLVPELVAEVDRLTAERDELAHRCSGYAGPAAIDLLLAKIDRLRTLAAALEAEVVSLGGNSMRPEWTDAEKAEAAGIAHDAAFCTVCPEPEGGWRNSYSYPDPLARAHLEAHQVTKDYPVYDGGRSPMPDAYVCAWLAILRWERNGRPIIGYEAYVPRLSEGSTANPQPADNPKQRP